MMMLMMMIIMMMMMKVLNLDDLREKGELQPM